MITYWRFCGLKPDLRGVDRDVLVALGLQGVHEVGPLERHAAALGDLLELLELAFRQRAGVVEEAADEGGFAVVHVADDDDLELLGALGEENGRALRTSHVTVAA